MSSDTARTYVLGPAGQADLRAFLLQISLYVDLPIAGVAIGAMAAHPPLIRTAWIAFLVNILLMPWAMSAIAGAYTRSLNAWQVFVNGKLLGFKAGLSTAWLAIGKVRKIRLVHDRKGQLIGCWLWQNWAYVWYVPRVEGLENLMQEIKAHLPEDVETGYRERSFQVLVPRCIALITVVALVSYAIVFRYFH